MAHHRLSRIADLLTQDEITKVRNEVREKFSRDVDPKYWNIFLNGPQEQWDQVSEEVYSALEEHFRLREQQDAVSDKK